MLSEESQFEEVQEGIQESEERSSLSIPESEVAMYRISPETATSAIEFPESRFESSHTTFRSISRDVKSEADTLYSITRTPLSSVARNIVLSSIWMPIGTSISEDVQNSNVFQRAPLDGIR